MNPLAEVVTVCEAARMFEKHRMSIYRAIDGGLHTLRARKSDHGWLISLDSCIARWGAPKHPLNDGYNI